MMNFRQPDELPEIPIAGRQAGDINLVTTNGVMHLPNCSVVGSETTVDWKPPCTCGAKFVKSSEFTSTPTVTA